MSLPNHLLEQLLSICKTPQNRDMLVEAIETGGGDLDATEIAYDNTDSGLTATDLQSAVDELAAGSGGGGVSSDLSDLTSPTAINEDLAFESGKVGQISSKSETFNTQAMNVKSGDSGNNSGAVTVSSGQATAGSGSVYLISGDAGSGDSGSIVLDTGASSGGTRGKIVLSTDTRVLGSFSPDSIAGADLGTEALPFAALEAVQANLRWAGQTLYLSHDGTSGTIGSTLGLISFDTARLSDVVNPVNAQDAATKNYVDNKVTGASGSFVSSDAKTVTVVNGLITSIV